MKSFVIFLNILKNSALNYTRWLEWFRRGCNRITLWVGLAESWLSQQLNIRQRADIQSHSVLNFILAELLVASNSKLHPGDWLYRHYSWDLQQWKGLRIASELSSVRNTKRTNRILISMEEDYEIFQDLKSARMEQQHKIRQQNCLLWKLVLFNVSLWKCIHFSKPAVYVDKSLIQVWKTAVWTSLLGKEMSLKRPISVYFVALGDTA